MVGATASLNVTVTEPCAPQQIGPPGEVSADLK
jgi:hypothetical protein